MLLLHSTFLFWFYLFIFFVIFLMCFPRRFDLFMVSMLCKMFKVLHLKGFVTPLKFQDYASEKSWSSLRYLLLLVIFGNVHLFTLNYLWNILKYRFFSTALQLTSGNVGLTEHVEGEPRHFMVWVGTSIANALVLHTFEVSSLMKFNSVEYKAIEETSTETAKSRTLISGFNRSNLVFINVTPCSVW